jgi:hypothetical protein
MQQDKSPCVDFHCLIAAFGERWILDIAVELHASCGTFPPSGDGQQVGSGRHPQASIVGCASFLRHPEPKRAEGRREQERGVLVWHDDACMSDRTCKGTSNARLLEDVHALRDHRLHNAKIMGDELESVKAMMNPTLFRVS